MICEFVQKICAELSIPLATQIDSKNIYQIKLGSKTPIDCVDLLPGLGLRAPIAAIPNRRKEEIFVYVMRANLLGQGTALSRIGMDKQEKSLTLSLGIPYELDYRSFREAFEEFANHLIYWRAEILKFEQNQPMY